MRSTIHFFPFSFFLLYSQRQHFGRYLSTVGFSVAVLTGVGQIQYCSLLPCPTEHADSPLLRCRSAFYRRLYICPSLFPASTLCWDGLQCGAAVICLLVKAQHGGKVNSMLIPFPTKDAMLFLLYVTFIYVFCKAVYSFACFAKCSINTVYYYDRQIMCHNNTEELHRNFETTFNPAGCVSGGMLRWVR